MRILIIEDDQNKIKILSNFLVEIMQKVDIIKRFSYQSGLKEIVKGGYDVIFLDMSMPTFDITPHETGGSPRPFAGKEILKQMERRKIDIPVIVVTQFERFGEGTSTITITELIDELNKLHKDIYMGTVYYNAALNNWKDDISGLLQNINSIRRYRND